eukprot:TRINITY_DN982_c0_g1_i2.p1 TRINITY_DN982_c0_g1~~TRINITY_DN982_c0_g1_i2.p1  ORF type:complete len:226 (+),score=42.20 TRINITY_DN982_c0_g1_i2:42-680(+)
MGMAQCDFGSYGDDCSCAGPLQEGLLTRIKNNGGPDLNATCASGVWTLDGDLLVGANADTSWNIATDTILINGAFSTETSSNLYFDLDGSGGNQGKIIVSGGVVTPRGNVYFDLYNAKEGTSNYYFLELASGATRATADYFTVRPPVVQQSSTLTTPSFIASTDALFTAQGQYIPVEVTRVSSPSSSSSRSFPARFHAILAGTFLIYCLSFV